VTIEPPEPYKVGDLLTCSSDGHDPTYTWTGTAGVDGAIVSGDLATYMLPTGPFNVFCTATVDELSCCESMNLISKAYGKYQQESRAISGKTTGCRCKF